jgi:hypothetical protein
MQQPAIRPPAAYFVQRRPCARRRVAVIGAGAAADEDADGQKGKRDDGEDEQDEQDDVRKPKC